MNRSADQPSPGELEEILLHYLEAIESGQAPAVGEICRQHPTYAEDIREFVESEQDLLRWAGPTVAEHARQVSSITTSRLVNATSDTRSFALPLKGERKPREIPEVFGRYRILRRLGGGAMGTVFLAHDEKLERNVALKIPHCQLEVDSELAKRFDREAKAAAGLHHPNICSVHDVGELAGTHYLAMAYIEGTPLDHGLYSGQPAEPSESAELVLKLARALREAHAKGVVHRDLKPANIMIDADGEPVIMDFGLALQTDRQDQVRVTQQGTIIGTPAYMAPEQIDGDLDVVGPASDIYSLGVIFYESLTGRLPFRGGLSAVVHQILSKPPVAPSELRPGLDPRLERICLGMLRKTTAERYASMDEVAEDLEAALTLPDHRDSVLLEELVAERETHRRRSRAWLGVALVSLVLLPLGIWLAGQVFRTEYGTVEIEIPQGIEGVQVRLSQDGRRGRELDPVIGRSFQVEKGRYEVGLAGEVDRFRVDQKMVDVRPGHPVQLVVRAKSAGRAPALELKQLRHWSIPGQPYALAMSPDGQSLIVGGRRADGAGFLQHFGLHEGTQRRRDFDDAIVGEAVSWFDEKKFAIGTSAGMIHLIHRETLETVSKAHVSQPGFVKPAFSPDRKYLAAAEIGGSVSLRTVGNYWLLGKQEIERCRALAFYEAGDGLSLVIGGLNAVHVWDLATEEVTELCETSGHVRDLAMLRGSRQLLLVTANGVIQCVSVPDGKVIRELAGHEAAIHSVDVSPDERFAVTGSSDGTIRVWDLSSGKELFRGVDPTGATSKVAVNWPGGRIYSGDTTRRSPQVDVVREWELDLPMDLGPREPVPENELLELLRARNWKEAMTALRRNAALAPSYNYFRAYRLAMVLLLMQDGEAYRRQQDELVASLRRGAPSSPWLKAQYALACSLGTIDKQDAATILASARDALAAERTWDTVHPLVVVLYRLGRFDEAAAVSERAIEFSDSVYWRCLNHLWQAMIRQRQANQPAAQEHLREALRFYDQLTLDEQEPIPERAVHLHQELSLVLPEARRTLAEPPSVLPTSAAADPSSSLSE